MRHFSRLTIGAVVLLVAGLAFGQYGTGVTVDVSQVDPAALTLDGNADESVWADATTLTLGEGNFTNWGGGWNDGYGENIDIGYSAKMLFAPETLYVYVEFQDYQELYWGGEGNPWGGEQIFFGVDGTHELDTLTNEEYHGWPGNAPDKGPTVYKINKDGITLNWGYDGVAPTDSGWTRGTVAVDDANFSWTVEMAIYVPQIEAGGQIGFNLGGATAHPDSAYMYDTDYGAAEYAYFAYHQEGDPGSINIDASTFSTLQFAGGSDSYGTGVEVGITEVASGDLTLDGTADEGAWSDATTLTLGEGNFTNWSGGWNDDYGENIDIGFNTKLLFATDTLYVFADFQDYQELYWGGEGNPWGGEQIFIGVDGTHAGDDQTNSEYHGWPGNAPDLGPTVYKINKDGITLNWGYDGISPVDSGWVRGTVSVDDANFYWAVEMAIYLPQVESGNQVGFNVGGATAHPDSAYMYDPDYGAAEYAYFAYHQEGDPGNINIDGSSFSTLNLGFGVAIDPVSEYMPTAFQLKQNYPNPFNPSTTIGYSLIEKGHVNLTIYNALGQQVSTLVRATQSPGEYSVDWNAGNLSSGLYFYILEVDGKTVATRKALLMK
ncbi:MAG: T9SS type A sorting domain-containing protein [Candidatus Marinimicrobia bacterium]|nr:T9SS type A sorting domain-containing protein [Candidatus Neomarinimicrobiota bacterium]